MIYWLNFSDEDEVSFGDIYFEARDNFNIIDFKHYIKMDIIKKLKKVEESTSNKGYGKKLYWLDDLLQYSYCSYKEPGKNCVYNYEIRILLEYAESRKIEVKIVDAPFSYIGMSVSLENISNGK